MKKMAMTMLMGLVLGAATVAQAQFADGRIVFVDLDRVFTEFYKTKLADQQLQDMATEFNDERAALVEEYEALNETFNAAREQSQDTALSEEARNRSRSEAEELLIEIRDFESRIQRFDQSRRKQLDEQGRRMRGRIVEEIQDEIERYARTQGYQAVIDSSGQSANAVSLVLYADSRVDISDAMLEILNKGRDEGDSLE
jgi:Skp family chaperone for outer membrane proteins